MGFYILHVARTDARLRQRSPNNGLLRGAVWRGQAAAASVLIKRRPPDQSPNRVTVGDRIRCRRNQAYVTRLAVQAVEALNASTGGYGLLLSNPVQRAWRDANAVARHVSLNWDAVGTMYGQHAFGLEPRGQY